MNKTINNEQLEPLKWYDNFCFCSPICVWYSLCCDCDAVRVKYGFMFITIHVESAKWASLKRCTKITLKYRIHHLNDSKVLSFSHEFLNIDLICCVNVWCAYFLFGRNSEQCCGEQSYGYTLTICHFLLWLPIATYISQNVHKFHATERSDLDRSVERCL